MLRTLRFTRLETDGRNDALRLCLLEQIMSNSVPQMFMLF